MSSLWNVLRDFTAERLENRNRMRTYNIIRSLPEHIQKDIGWPEGVEVRRLRQRHETH